MTFENKTTMPDDYWVTFNAATQTVFAVLSHENQVVQNIPSTYTFILHARTQRKTSAETAINIRVSSNRKEISYVFQNYTNMDWKECSKY